MMKMMMMMSRSWLFTSWQPSLAFQYVLMQAELVFATWSLIFRCHQIHIHIKIQIQVLSLQHGLPSTGATKYTFLQMQIQIQVDLCNMVPHLHFSCFQIHCTIMVSTIILLIITKISIILSLLIILTTKILVILTTNPPGI